MATVKQPVGTRTSLAFTGTTLSALASGVYVQNTTAYDCSTNQPLDVVVEVDVTATSPAGNVYVFIRESLDGTTYRSGPTSGSSATDEPNLKPLGVVPMASSAVAQVGFFSIAASLGFVPVKFFIVIKNSAGVALTAGTVWTSEISSTVA